MEIAESVIARNTVPSTKTHRVIRLRFPRKHPILTVAVAQQIKMVEKLAWLPLSLLDSGVNRSGTTWGVCANRVIGFARTMTRFWLLAGGGLCQSLEDKFKCVSSADVSDTKCMHLRTSAQWKTALMEPSGKFHPNFGVAQHRRIAQRRTFPRYLHLRVQSPIRFIWLPFLLLQRWITRLGRSKDRLRYFFGCGVDLELTRDRSAHLLPFLLECQTFIPLALTGHCQLWQNSPYYVKR